MNIERNRVRSFIMDELLKGNIGEGDRLSLPYFANQLSCSVTPIREALTQLEYAKIVDAIPNRGFIIAALKSAEADHIYSILATLETLALESSKFSLADIKNLKAAQHVFFKAGTPLERIKADFKFHELLIGNCNNPLLLQYINDLKIPIFLYEKKYMSDNELKDTSNRQHAQIIESIEQYNIKKASTALKQNWLCMLKHT